QVALRSTEDLVAVSRYETARWAVIELVDVQTGRTVSALGSGRVEPDAWDASGDTPVVLRPAAGQGRTLDLWAVTVNRPESAWRIAESVSGAYAFSPDGAWLAVALEADPPQISFLRWTDPPAAP